MVPTSPPRRRLRRNGGGGAAVGLIASLGLRGDRRFGRAGSSAWTGVAGGWRLRNMNILCGLRWRPSPLPLNGAAPLHASSLATFHKA